MAGSRKEKGEDYSKRYPGAQEVRGDAEWFNFAKPGDELVGVFKGVVKFRNGHKGTILTPDGLRVFSASTLLQQKLEAVEVGQRVAICFARRGKDTGKGEPMKEFYVGVLPDDEEAGQ